MLETIFSEKIHFSGKLNTPAKNTLDSYCYRECPSVLRNLKDTDKLKKTLTISLYFVTSIVGELESLKEERP